MAISKGDVVNVRAWWRKGMNPEVIPCTVLSVSSSGDYIDVQPNVGNPHCRTVRPAAIIPAEAHPNG